MSKRENQKENTTIALTVADSQRITRHCKALSIPKKDFIPIILDFLENNGVNPKTDHAPKTELAQIKKRIDQYFGFIKTQEKEFLRPMLEAIQATENRLQNQIDELVKKDDIIELSSKEFSTKIASKLVSIISKHINEKTTEIEKKLNAKNKFLVAKLESIEADINQVWEKQNEKKGFFNR